MSEATDKSARLQAFGSSLRKLVEEPAPKSTSKTSRSRKHIVIGVTTYNRLEYLQKFVETFLATKDPSFRHTLIVADDGSFDGSQEFIKQLELDTKTDVILIQNQSVGVAGQTNSILYAASKLIFDFGFKADDDVIFRKPGWESLYLEAAQESGFEHLVLYNREWKQSTSRRKNRGLVTSSTDVYNSMGCFWTFTPNVIQQVGYFDEIEFPVRGNSHLDYSARACRLGMNSEATLFDAFNSEKYIELWARDHYIPTFNWRSSEAKRTFTPQERSRRESVVRDSARAFIGYNPVRFIDPIVWSSNALLTRRFIDFEVSSADQSAKVPYAFVMNLSRTSSRWIETSERLRQIGIRHERVEGIDGYSEKEREAWRKYAATGLVDAREKKLGRKLIQSPGARGYLLSAKKVIRRARAKRLESFILFDDDVVAHIDAVALLKNTLSQLPENWKLLYLGSRQTTWDGTEQISSNLYRNKQIPMGSYALAIHHTAYDLIENEIDKMVSPFDAGPLEELWKRHPSEVFVAWPPVFLPNVDDSIIRESRDINQLAVGSNWNFGDYPDLRTESSNHQERELPTVDIICPITSWVDSHIRRMAESMARQSGADLKLTFVVDYDLTPKERLLLEICEADSRIDFVQASSTSWLHDSVNLALSRSNADYVFLASSPLILLDQALENAISELESRSLGILTVKCTSALGELPPIGRLAGLELADANALQHGSLLFTNRSLQKIGGLTLDAAIGGPELLRRASRNKIAVGQSASVLSICTENAGEWKYAIARTLDNSDFAAEKAAQAHTDTDFVDITRREDGRPKVCLVSLPR